MRSFEYIRPESVTEAINILEGSDTSSLDRSKILAGGTDLLTLMKHDISTPTRLVDIKRLPELEHGISETTDGITIGALTTLSRIEQDSTLRSSHTALADAAAAAASPQLRNMATIGGNLLQRPRCWYYRSEQVDCWLKGGEDCPARDGENQHHAILGDSPCVAVHPSDLATALVALDATLTVHGSDGKRDMPLEAFFAQPSDDRRLEHTLAPDDVIVSVQLPNAHGNVRSTYLKAMDRKVWAFALVGVGVRLVMDGDRISDARLVLGGVATIPWRAREAEDLLAGASPSGDLFAGVADAAVSNATPLAKNGYKVPMLRSLIHRALTDASSNPI